MWPPSPTGIINMEAGMQVWLWALCAVAATLEKNKQLFAKLGKGLAQPGGKFKTRNDFK